MICTSVSQTFLTHGPSFQKISDELVCFADILHELFYSKVCNFQEGFVRDLWNYLWTIRNCNWTTGGSPGHVKNR